MRINRLLTASFLVTALVAAFTVVSQTPAGAVLQGANGRIVWVSERDGNQEIYTSRPDGTGVQRLTHNTAKDYDPAFSSDGSKIAFVSDRSGSVELYVMNADGANQKRLTNNTLTESHPTWDPPSKQIAFAGLNGTDSDLYKIQANGTGQVDLTPDTASFDANPSWSPGGLNIAFDRTDSTGTNIWTVVNDGTGLTELANQTGTDSNPAYGPDNKTLAFQSGRDNLPPTPSVFASIQKPVGVAFTSTQMLVTQLNKDKVLAVDSSGVTSTFATLPPTFNATLERYIAVSPGLGCFAPGDVYVTVRQDILKITPDGQTITTFATISGLPNSNNFLVFDKVGTFQNDLIVVGGQKAKVYKVDCNGNSTPVADLGALVGATEGEGSDVAPLTWAPYGGDLLVGDKEESTVWAVTPSCPGAGCTVTAVGTWHSVEQAIAVPSTLCDYGLSGGTMFVALENFNGGQIVKFPSSLLSGLGNQVLSPSEGNPPDDMITDIGKMVSDGTTITTSQFWPSISDPPTPDLEETAFAPCGGHNAPAAPGAAGAATPAASARSSAAGPAASCPLCPHEIYKMQAKDGSGLVRLTNNTTDDGHPAWSSDGTQITFQADRDDPNQPGCESTLTCKYEIYTMSSLDGSGQTNITGNTANDYAPDWEGLSYPPVVVTDSAFTPSTAKPSQGGSVLWDFQDGNQKTHTVTDNCGFSPHLFDSGAKSAGQYFVFKFLVAAQYPYVSTGDSGMSGTVKVAIKASPKTGDLSTVFTVTWATNIPPPGYVYDVQIERPGGTFVDWITNTALTSSTFVADSGAGTYGFQSRIRQPGTTAACLYSAPVFITVTQ